MVTVLGLNGMQFLRSNDPVERVVIQAVAKEAQESYEQHQKNLSIHIANAVSRMFKS